MARRRVYVVSANAEGFFWSEPINLALIKDPLVRVYAQGPNGPLSVSLAVEHCLDYDPETQTGTWTHYARTGTLTTTAKAKRMEVASGFLVGWARFGIEVYSMPPGSKIIGELWSDATVYESAKNTPPARRHPPQILDDVFDTESPEVPQV